MRLGESCCSESRKSACVDDVPPSMINFFSGIFFPLDTLSKRMDHNSFLLSLPDVLGLSLSVAA